MCPPGPCWQWPVPADQTYSAPSGVHKRVCTSGFLWCWSTWLRCVFLNGRRKISGLLWCLLPLCVYVNKWLFVCVCVCVRIPVMQTNPLPSKSAYLSVVMCMSPSTPQLFSVLLVADRICRHSGLFCQRFVQYSVWGFFSCLLFSSLLFMRGVDSFLHVDTFGLVSVLNR